VAGGLEETLIVFKLLEAEDQFPEGEKNVCGFFS
jgi:hypothetical protein